MKMRRGNVEGLKEGFNWKMHKLANLIQQDENVFFPLPSQGKHICQGTVFIILIQVLLMLWMPHILQEFEKCTGNRYG